MEVDLGATKTKVEISHVYSRIGHRKINHDFGYIKSLNIHANALTPKILYFHFPDDHSPYHMYDDCCDELKCWEQCFSKPEKKEHKETYDKIYQVELHE